MSAEVHIDADQVFEELDRLAFVRLAAFGLDSVLSRQWQATQQAVHVRTGSLRNSGDLASHFTGEVWEGELSYGGPSPGFPNDPVVYAVYEKARGGEHDFRAPAVALGHQYGQVVHEQLAGR